MTKLHQKASSRREKIVRNRLATSARSLIEHYANQQNVSITKEQLSEHARELGSLIYNAITKTSADEPISKPNAMLDEVITRVLSEISGAKSTRKYEIAADVKNRYEASAKEFEQRLFK